MQLPATVHLITQANQHALKRMFAVQLVWTSIVDASSANFVDHSIVHRWAVRMLPVLASVFWRRKRAVGGSWRMDETYIKVAGKSIYRAVDRAGGTVDFLLTANRDKDAARRFLERAINLHGVPGKITIDKSGANTAAI